MNPMKTTVSLFILGVLLGLPAGLQAKVIRTVEKTFSVQPGGNFKAATVGGDIVILTADAAEIHIVAKETIQASSEKEADELLEKLALTFVQSGNDVTAEAKYEKHRMGSWFKNWPPVQVGFTVTVPRNFNVNLATSGGNISVASLNGNARARTSGGDLEFDRIDGEIDGQTSGGNISLKEGTAKASLNTSGGNIEVDRAGGPTEVSTSGGDIRINSVTQLISATTSGGNVKATLTEPLRQDALLSTSGGDVKVQVLKSAAFQLDASTSGGEVDASGLTITMEKGGGGKSRLAGSVNGGGPKLTLRTSGGDIVIRAD
jgi:DUF4097 and DUF4098 domain-containing protein YvlB